MSRYIDADALKARIQAWKDRLNGYYGTNDDMVITLDKVQIQIIDYMPTVDAVPVVRCAQCKHGSKCLLGVVQCKMYGYKHQADWFCADGERKDGGRETDN